MARAPAKAADAVGVVGELLRAPGAGFGTTATILKTAGACAVAFALADLFGSPTQAVFAPILALTTVQTSVYGTLAQALQRTLGTLVGVVLATLWVNFVGEVTWWSIGLAMLVTIAAASRLPIGFAGQVQIPLAVLLVIALGPTTESYAGYRAVDCLIGGAVGIGASFLLPERPTTREAYDAHDRWAASIVGQLRAIAEELKQQPRVIAADSAHRFIVSSRELYDVASAGRGATVRAAESVFFNPRGRRYRTELDALRLAERWLVRLSLQVRMVSYTIDQMYDRAGIDPRLPRATLLLLVNDLADLLEDRWRGVPVETQSSVVRRELADAVEAISKTYSGALPVLESVSLLGRLDQLRQEISDTRIAAALDPDVVPVTSPGSARPVDEPPH